MSPVKSLKTVALLPNLFTLANAGLGLLAISKAIDALAGPPELFYRKLETACWLIFLAMVFDALDGKIARLTRTFSDFGAQLDSFADALTFGVAPAILAKVLFEHEGGFHPRLHFLAAASFALMAILRLARFNLESEHDAESHQSFSGLPSPAAAGTLIATLLMFLSLGGGIEVTDGDPTPVAKGLSVIPESWRAAIATALLPTIVFLLPILGLLMVSRVPYAHGASLLYRGRDRFTTLVTVVFIAFILYLAPVPVLFLTGWVYVVYGVARSIKKPAEPAAESNVRAG
jgi:CDP-diacylglycerol--serine O-phosphatidyltransferase